MLPQAVENCLHYCETRIARFQEASNTGLITIQCSPYRNWCKVKCHSGDFQYFLIPLEDLAVWKTTPLSRQRENLETVKQVLAKLNSALFETFCVQQGYANIAILHRGQGGQYGFLFSPTVIHGIKPC